MEDSRESPSGLQAGLSPGTSPIAQGSREDRVHRKSENWKPDVTQLASATQHRAGPVGLAESMLPLLDHNLGV